MPTILTRPRNENPDGGALQRTGQSSSGGRDYRAEFEAAFPTPILSHTDLWNQRANLPEGFTLIGNAAAQAGEGPDTGSGGGRWDVILPDGSQIDVVNGTTFARQWEVVSGPSGGTGTSSSSSGTGTGSTAAGYIDNDGIARNDDGSIDVEGQCAIRGGKPFVSPEGYHRCDAPITGYAVRRSDPFSLDMHDLISAGQKQALQAAEKEKAKLRFGGRRSTILAGFGVGTSANRRTTLLGSDKGLTVPKGADRDLGPGNPRSDGTIAGSQSRDTSVRAPSSSSGSSGSGSSTTDDRPAGRPGNPATKGTENREDTGRKAKPRPKDEDKRAVVPRTLLGNAA